MFKAHSQTNNILVYVRMYAVTERSRRSTGRLFHILALVPTAQSGPRPGDNEAAGLSRLEMSSAWQ